MATATGPPMVAIEIRASVISGPEHGRRCWDVCVHGPGSQDHAHFTTTLDDPFPMAAYEAYEMWLRSKKLESSHDVSKSLLEAPASWWPPKRAQLNSEARLETVSVSSQRSGEDLETLSTSVDAAEDSRESQCGPPTIQEYREQLRRVLGLDGTQTATGIKIYITEDVDPPSPDHSSIHGLMWELLEPYDSEIPKRLCPGEGPSPSQQHQQAVEVHRILTGVNYPIQLTQGLRAPDAPIRLLLVIARGLQVDLEAKFVDIQSVVHDTLCSVRKYLRSCGRQERLQIDTVRPGTLRELEEHLQRSSAYDMVHLDVHGRVGGPDDIPELLFSQPGPCAAAPSDNGQVSLNSDVFNIVQAEVVADLLAKYRIPAVVLSACLSSWAQGKPLSNMCRIFASRGLRIVTGISFTAWSDKVEAYYAGFYPALVLANYGFRRAALHSRLTLQHRLLAEHQCREALEGERRRLEKRQQDLERSRRQKRRRRSKEQKDKKKMEAETTKQTYPTVTTYYLAGKTFDRTNSEILGVDLDRSLIPKPTTWLARFWSRNPHIWAVLTPFLRLALPSRWITPADHLTTFEFFRARPENKNKLHSVGLMALEDRLKALGTLYIHMATSPTRQQLIQDVRESWLSTNFATRVEVISASFFRWSLLYFFLHISSQLSRIRSLWRPRNRGDGKTILVIDKVDHIFHKGVTRDLTAVRRMHRYIGAAEKEAADGFYLIVMSMDDVDWSLLDLDADEFPWVTAQPFEAKAGLVVFRSPGS
ncbi:hypothetical protein OQA88_11668 [Cercophora sp. LCS_1]